MIKRLINLPGNLLRTIVGVLPHDDNENGTTKGYTDGHFKEWCESMGGKVITPGQCAFQMQEDEYRGLHDQLYKRSQANPENPMSSEFIDKYNQYMGGQ